MDDGQITHLVCQTVQQLRASLHSSRWIWGDYCATLEDSGTQVLFVLIDEIDPQAVEHANLIMPFFNVPAISHIQRRIEQTLRERGVTRMLELLEFLQTPYRELPDTVAAVQATLYGMIARAELISTGYGDQTRVSTGTRPHPWTGLPGVTYQQLIERLTIPRSVVAPVRAPLTEAERRYLASKRGERYRILFSHLHDRTSPLKQSELLPLMGASGLSERSIWRFKSLLIELRRTIVALTYEDVIPHLMSNRVAVTRRVSLAVEEVMERRLGEVYFQPLGEGIRARHVTDVLEMVRTDCLAQGLLIPAYNTLVRCIARMEAREPHRTVLLRHGRDAAQRLQPRQGAHRVLDYGGLLTIDCTPADVITLSDGQVSVIPVKGRQKPAEKTNEGSRASLIFFGDAATGQLIRVFVVTGRISSQIVLLLLRRIILGLRDEFAPAGIKAIPQGWGLPRRIRIDGGSEFVNAQVARVVEMLGIEVLPRNRWSRHHGGLEERTIQSIVFAQHVLEGTTTNSIIARKDYNPFPKAKITLNELNKFQLLNQESFNLQCAPRQLLTRHGTAEALIQAGRSAWRPPTERQLEFVTNRFHPSTKLICHRSGIRLHDLIYVAPELASLITRRAQVEVLYNPDDVRIAHVVDPATDTLIQVLAILPSSLDPDTPLNLITWRAVNRELKKIARSARDKTRTPLENAQVIVNQRTVIERIVGLYDIPDTESKISSNVGLSTIEADNAAMRIRGFNG